ncbi:MAG: PAS domain S-box protein, partial [Petrotogales bacterium]
ANVDLRFEETESYGLLINAAKIEYKGKAADIVVFRDITKRKQVEEEMKRARDDYLCITNLTGDIIVKVDTEGRWTFLNDGACEFWGKPRQKLLGRAFADYLHPEDVEKTNSAIQELIKTKQTAKGLINRQKTPQGYRIVEWNSTPIFEKGEKYAGLQATGRDITERRKMEEAIQESEEKFKNLLEASPDVVFRLTKSGHIEYVSSNVKEMYGYYPDELIGKHLKITTPAEELPNALKGLKTILDGKSLKNFEINQKGKVGQIISMEINANPVEKDGKIVGLQGIMRNITERKRVEDKLKESEEKYRNLVELAPDAIVTIGMNGIITSCNTAALKMVGYSREEYIGRHFTQLGILRKRDLPKFVKTFMTAIKEKENINPLEFQYIRKDGTKGWAEGRYKLQRKNGRTIGMQVIIRDISNRKKTEEKLKEAHEKLKVFNKKLEEKVKERTVEVEKLLKQKDEFINQLSHDLRSPLTPLTALLPAIEEKEQDPHLKEELEIIHRNVKYLNKLVGKTIELARLNSPNTQLSLDPTILLNEINNIKKKNRLVFEENKIKFMNRVDEDIMVKVDRLMLGELFDNLISNAVKYSPQGGTITIDAKDDGKWVTISIKDTGIGMTKEELDHIFEEFYKADWSRHDHESSGLGLSICKGVVKKHGGHIWAESPGMEKGTTVSFTLPSFSKRKEKLTSFN